MFSHGCGPPLWGRLPFYVLTLLVGTVLILVWVIYLAFWAVGRHGFSWRLLVIPTIGALGLAAVLLGVPQDLRWTYDEPRFTRAAEQALADPRPEFYDSTDHRIGTLDVYATAKKDGIITFSFSGGGFSVDELEYRPDGTSPGSGSEVRASRLSDDWWHVLID
jgi:hypothetical protein